MSSPAPQTPATPGSSTSNPQQPGGAQQQSSDTNNPPHTPAGPSDAQRTASLSAMPSTQDIDKIVASYLQKKGYRATEAMFQRELGGNVVSLDDLSKDLPANRAMPSHILRYKDGQEGEPDAYDVSYRNLREWIENSLDWYKVMITRTGRVYCNHCCDYFYCHCYRYYLFADTFF